MSASAAELRREVLEVVRRLGYVRRDQAFQLSSGGWSHDYVDGKRALAGGAELRLAAEAVVATAAERGVAFDAVGGLTMGADPLAHAVAVVSGARWFSVRKEAKDHGAGGRVAGALGPGDRVVVTEDAVTRGASPLEAVRVVREVGAEVVGVVAVVDRGGTCAALLEPEGIPFTALVTAPDLGFAYEGA